MPEHQGVRLLDGDFILVELLERPPARLGILDDGSRGDDLPLEETMSQVSSSSDGNYEGPAIFVVHRPRFRATDSRVCWIASDTRSTINELHIARHWPYLRNNDYYTLAAHKSLQRDMPDAPQIQHQIILPDADFLPRPQVRGVLVYLRIDKVQELYAVPLATRTSAYGLYHWAGILPVCQQTPSECGAWINGEKIYGATSARLTHADYVKIAFWEPDTQPELHFRTMTGSMVLILRDLPTEQWARINLMMMLLLRHMQYRRPWTRCQHVTFIGYWLRSMQTLEDFYFFDVSFEDSGVLPNHAQEERCRPLLRGSSLGYSSHNMFSLLPL